MPNLVSTPHWPEIQRLAELGVPLPTLAERFDVNVKTLYNRCGSEDWLIPRRLKAKISQSQNISGKTGSDPLFGGLSNAENSRSLLVETWQDKAEHVRTVAYEAAIEAIESSSGKIVIETASDLKHAVHVARQATGLLDTDAPQIQLSLFGNGDICGPAIMENQAHDVEPLQELPESPGFWD